VKLHGFKALVGALLTTALTSCTTFYDIYFVPAPLEVRIGDGEDPSGLARALVVVQGVRRPDAELAQPARFELKMHFENIGNTPLEIEPESFELVSADLQPCGTPRLVQVLDHALAAGEAFDFDLFVPLPEGKTVDDFDLRGLNLNWAVRFGSRRIVTGVSFQRYIPMRYDYYDPFYPSGRWGCETHCTVGVFRAY
jgi:hypothetical protein